MKINMVLALATMLIISVLCTRIALAAGSVYFAAWGSDSPGCGVSVPCKEYSYAYARAQSLSITEGGGFTIYHLPSRVRYGYADMTGGSGPEPGDPVSPVPYDYGGILWRSLGTLLVGFVLGRLFLKNRQKPTGDI